MGIAPENAVLFRADGCGRRNGAGSCRKGHNGKIPLCHGEGQNQAAFGRRDGAGHGNLRRKVRDVQKFRLEPCGPFTCGRLGTGAFRPFRQVEQGQGKRRLESLTC